MTKQLDMLTDEPLELAVALRQLAEKQAGEEARGRQRGEGLGEVLAGDERACARSPRRSTSRKSRS